MKTTADKPEKKLKRPTCPKCSAPITRQGEELVSRCSFCLSALMLDLDGWHCVFRHNPQISRERLPLYLKDFFGRSAALNPPRLLDSEPWLLPFWQKSGWKSLRPANSAFPAVSLPRPSSASQPYNPQDTESIGFMPADIDQSGEESEDLQADLVYLPFYKISLEIDGEKYQLLLDAISGIVYGDYPGASEIHPARNRFYQFSAAGLVFFSIFFLIENPLPPFLISMLLFLFILFLPPLSGRRPR